MIPPPAPARPIAPFPYVGVATIVLLINAIVLALVPPSPYRAALAIIALFAIGYCALALIVGRTFRLSAAEILAFSTGLTILITSLSALGVSLLGIPITQFAVVIIGLPIGIMTWLLRRPVEPPWTSFGRFAYQYFDFSEYSKAEKRIVIALFAAIVAAMFVLLSLAFVYYPERPTPGISVAGPDGNPDSLNGTFVAGQSHTVIVTVLGGPVAGTYSVRIRLVPANATGNESFHNVTPPFSPLQLDPFAEYREYLTIAARGTWTQSFDIVIVVSTATDFDLRFELLGDIGTVVATNVLRVSAS